MLITINQSETGSISYFDDFAHSLFSSNSRNEVFSSRQFQNKLIERVELFIANGGNIISFDVFDTILLRNEKSELRRFYEMADLFSEEIKIKLDIECDALSVFYARLLSTKNSYRFSASVKGCREGKLDDIHKGIVRMLGLPESFAQVLTDIEIKYETNNLSLNPAISSLLAAISETGAELVLISDMYMGKKHISQLLDFHLPGYFHHRQIFSSGDLTISKRSCLLFDHVANELRVDPINALHIGDNPESDYICARKCGWQAIYLPHTDRELENIDFDEKKLYNEFIALGVDLKTLLQD